MAEEQTYDIDGHPVGGYPEERHIVDMGAQQGGSAETGEKVVDLAAMEAGLPKRAVKNKDGTITMPLLFPVAIKIRDMTGQEKQEHYDSLTFRRLRGKDIRIIQAAKPDMLMVTSFSCATGIPLAVMSAVFDEMDAVDLNDGGSVIASFTANGR